ncbi:hypothetical protein KC363_g70 [Hortaea werneckii]|nr:hypothetical protein KC363_g70 [Hortaea werneckii]
MKQGPLVEFDDDIVDTVALAFAKKIILEAVESPEGRSEELGDWESPVMIALGTVAQTSSSTVTECHEAFQSLRFRTAAITNFQMINIVKPGRVRRIACEDRLDKIRELAGCELLGNIGPPAIKAKLCIGDFSVAGCGGRGDGKAWRDAWRPSSAMGTRKVDSEQKRKEMELGVERWSGQAGSEISEHLRLRAPAQDERSSTPTSVHSHQNIVQSH